ncbi:MAG: TonB family protein [Bacteroidales bacterium]|nr:TonB family protein [Bacteroidales bacterium]
MTPELLYIARASLYLAIFYAFYLLVMRKTSLFRFNRAALLAGTVVCHLLPLLRLRTVTVPDFSGIQVGELQMVSEEAGQAAAPFPWLLALYAAGVAAVLVLSLVSIARTRKIIRSGSPEPCEGCRLTLVDRDVPSFSWGRKVVMSRQDYEKYPAILRHELQHIHAHHSLDVLLMTAVNAIHWFNPLAWIARAELRLLHEYEADEGLIRQGIDATSYQLLLVRKAVGEQRFSLANGFNHAKLKQRIAMMHKKPTSGWMRLAYVALLPLLAGTMFLCNPARAEIRPASPETATVAEMPAIAETPTTQNPPAGDSVPFASIEQKPTFNGGDAVEFSKWVAENLKYPKEAYEDGIQGRVMVAFKVCEDGEVRDVKVIRGVNELLDAEAVRVVSASPKWEPGYQDGKPVNVTYSFPVVFKLRGNENSGEVVNSFSVNGSFMIRSTDGAMPLVYLDGVKYTGDLSKIDPATISSMEVLKDEKAIEKYGEEAKNGIILITTKKQ